MRTIYVSSLESHFAANLPTLVIDDKLTVYKEMIVLEMILKRRLLHNAIHHFSTSGLETSRNV
jgi:hypothetical protein